jgi:hypothetical protein
MYKSCFIALLAFPAALYSQDLGHAGASASDAGSSISSSAVSGLAISSSAISSSADSSSTDGTAAEAPAPMAAAGTAQVDSSSQGFFSRGVFMRRKKDTPVGSFTASYVYRYAPDLFGADRSQMGWSAVPEVNFTKYVGLQAEFTGLYTRSIYPGTNQFMAAAGPRFTLAPHRKITPFAFAEGGMIRTTHQLSDVSDWNPVVTGGIGFDYKISHSVAFQLVPGEYMGQKQDDGDWNHSFVAKAGITFNLFR